jgi:hypothetical protein
VRLLYMSVWGVKVGAALTHVAVVLHMLH